MIKSIYLALIFSLGIISVNAIPEKVLYLQELNNPEFTEAEIVGWTNNKGITQQLGSCGTTSLLGGYNKFGQGTVLSKTYTNLPPHVRVQVEFEVYLIDSWNSGDQFDYQIDEIPNIGFRSTGEREGGNICGGTSSDDVTNLSVSAQHTGDSFQIKFYENLDESLTNESWGIRNVNVYLYVEPVEEGCAEGEQDIGGQCFTREDLTQCSDSLKPLIDNIKSDCTQEEKDEEFFYKFNVDYIAPYIHNADCFTQEIYVEETKLIQGEAEFDQWTFDEVSQQIVFSIKQDDLEDKYACTRTETETEFTWSCDFQLHLLLGGEVKQHIFNFEMKVTLDKIQKDVLNLKVTYDESSGDCCENELNIDTELKFCTTFECLEYHELPYTAQRSQELYLEHSITSPDFLNYYLHPSEVVIFGVVADIIEVDGTNTGKLIYKVKSQLAFDDMLVEVISILSDQEYAPLVGFRRFLQSSGSQSIRDDYDIKAISQISVVSDPKSNIEAENSVDTKTINQQEEINNSEEVKMLTIGLICTGALVGLLVLTGLSYVCYRRSYKNSRKAAYEENVPQQTQNTEVVTEN